MLRASLDLATNGRLERMKDSTHKLTAPQHGPTWKPLNYCTTLFRSDISKTCPHQLLLKPIMLTSLKPGARRSITCWISHRPAWLTSGTLIPRKMQKVDQQVLGGVAPTLPNSLHLWRLASHSMWPLRIRHKPLTAEQEKRNQENGQKGTSAAE